MSVIDSGDLELSHLVDPKSAVLEMIKALTEEILYADKTSCYVGG